MKKQRPNRTARAAIGLCAILGVAGLAIGVWATSSGTQPRTPAPRSQAPAAGKQRSAATTPDPSRNSAYLFIKEWRVRAALPSELRGAVSYVPGQSVTDPDGNRLQSVKIIIARDALTGSRSCSPIGPEQDTAVAAGAQYIRSERAKPLDKTRYRWNFRPDILQDSTYAYHLNYLTPDCIDATDTPVIEALHQSLTRLTTLPAPPG